MTDHAKHAAHGGRHYRRLLLMTLASFGAMYVLMYAMVDRLQNAIPNWNQAYMAGLMTAPMVVIELLLMRSMYPRKALNAILLGASVVVGASCFLLIRKQGGIGDEQFVTSMIPHHAAALLMCEEADLKDPELKRLCESIRAGQQAEIDQMRAILARLGK